MSFAAHHHHSSDHDFGIGVSHSNSSATPVTATRWRKAANKAANKVQKQRQQISRPEWRDFGERMISVLQSFDSCGGDDDMIVTNANTNTTTTGQDTVDDSATPSVSSTTTRTRENLVDLFRENPEFIKQCLLVCLEKRRGELRKFVEIVEEARIDRREKPLMLGGAMPFWHKMFETLYDRAVAMGDTKALREALIVAHDGSPPKVKSPWLNCNALVTACINDDLRMARLLLAKGYRLRSTHYDKVERERSWRDLPFRIPTEVAEKLNDDKDDEVYNLHILRAMSKPCYILSCYSVVSEAKRFKKDDSCKCCSNPSGVTHLNTYLTNTYVNQNTVSGGGDRTGGSSGNSSRNEFHFCPNHEKFVPSFGCTKHPACSDPVFRCFELSQIATLYAKKIPEYREEYLEISESSGRMAVELLEQCKDTGEVQLLLEEKTGSSSYFRKDMVKKMRYPKLNMAIQNNHKAFVGHMFCQQILRSQWHGRVPWNGRPYRFLVAYSLVQILMTVWHVLHYLFRMGLQDLGIDRDRWKRMRLSGRCYDYLAGPCNLDEPLNRFISYTGMYFVFWSLIILCVTIPMADFSAVRNNFHWYHDLLVVFTLSMVINDISALLSVRSFSHHFKFWHVYDIIMHFLLCCAFFARLLMGKVNPCPNRDCDQETIDARLPYDTVSNCFFAFSAIMGGLRFLYWFQLHDKIGPIVINLSRVVGDLATFAAIYFVLMISFVSALVPLKASNSRCPDINVTRIDEGGDCEGDNSCCWSEWTFEHFGKIFVEMMGYVFWSILNPGPPETFDTDKFDGAFAIFITAMYGVVAVIVLLNLLIAVMNATIQKLQGNQHLYWKFVRTSIWIEFFGDANAVPQPFNLITVLRSMIKAVHLRVLSKCREKRPALSPVTPGTESIEAHEARKVKVREQNLLMVHLLERFWSTSRSKASSPLSSSSEVSAEYSAKLTSVVRERMEEMKEDLRNEMLLMAKDESTSC